MLSFEDLSRIRKFARYWNIVGNSGRFVHLCGLFRKSESPFNQFMNFSDWLYKKSNQTHKISYQNMLKFLVEYLVETKGESGEHIRSLAQKDYARTTGKQNPPHFLKDNNSSQSKRKSGTARQQRHLK